MGMVMMGLALWHFAIWLPDRYWGGIVGAFLGALIGAALFGFIVNGLHIPGRHDTHLTTALEAIPGALIGMALVYFEGVRRRGTGQPAGSAFDLVGSTKTAALASRPALIRRADDAPATDRMPHCGGARPVWRCGSGPRRS